MPRPPPNPPTLSLIVWIPLVFMLFWLKTTFLSTEALVSLGSSGYLQGFGALGFGYLENNVFQ